MRQTQNEARLSAQWFENLSRYIDLKPRQFGALVHARRSALLPLLPPRLFYYLNHASREIGILRPIRRRIRPTGGGTAPVGVLPCRRLAGTGSAWLFLAGPSRHGSRRSGMPWFGRYDRAQ